MRIAILLSTLLLAGIATAAPTTDDDDDLLTIDESFFMKDLLKYTAKHEIVSINAPLNSLNDDSSEDENDRSLTNKSDEDETKTKLFFVLADIKENGEKDYKGLYVFTEGIAKKILDNGVAIASKVGVTREVYFGATDGLYRLVDGQFESEKYGPITDSIIDLVVLRHQDLIYILTEDYQLYKVTDNGTKKTKIDTVKNIREIVVDLEDNLYYLDADKNVFVASTDGNTKKVQGLPKPTSYWKLTRGFALVSDSANVVLDDKAYMIFANGTSEFADVVFKNHPSAYEPTPTLVQYYAYDKKIYEFNVVYLILADVLQGFKDFVNGKGGETLKTRKITKF